MSEKIGIVIIDKCEGMTSQTVVNRVKRIFGVKKAGHTGTLDPMATGVLPVLLERGVKASEFMLTSDKHYGATLLLGITTDTEDTTGEVLSRSETIPTEDAIRTAAESLVGEIMQTPHMYSALKVDGKKLYELAREGKVIDREPRKITVYSIGVERLSDREYYLDVVCSGGTYIRTICADIGRLVGCGGVMSSLRRLTASGFSISEAHTLEELENMTDEERAGVILPVERVFEKYDVVALPDFFARLAHHGLEIYQKKIKTAYNVGERVRLYDSLGFFAVGEVMQFEDGTAIKPIRQFR